MNIMKMLGKKGCFAKVSIPDAPVVALAGLDEYLGAFATESQTDMVLSKLFELSELDKESMNQFLPKST